VAALVELRKLALHKASHLEHAQHILPLVQKGKVVGEELDLEGVRELLDHFKVEEVEQLREEPVLRLIDVYLVDLSVPFLLGLIFLLRLLFLIFVVLSFLTIDSVIILPMPIKLSKSFAISASHLLGRSRGFCLKSNVGDI